MGINIRVHGSPNFWRKWPIVKRRKNEYSEAIDIYRSIKRLSSSEELLMYLSSQVGASVGMLISAEVNSNKSPK